MVTNERSQWCLRSAAEIAAETGLAQEVTVEALMAYCLSLAESDELITGFLRGDLTMVSLNEQTRQMVERDTRVLGLEAIGGQPAATKTTFRGPDRLSRKLELLKGKEAASRLSEKTSALEIFIQENPAIFAQVNAASHQFLVRWVMYYLMRGTKARERGHPVAHEFWEQVPKITEKIQTLAAGGTIGRRPQTTVRVGTGAGVL